MRFLFAIILFLSCANGANITDIRSEAKDDAVEITLSFNEPFSGKIINKQVGDRLMITLDTAFIDAPRLYSPKSDLLSSIRVNPDKNATQIIIARKTALEAVVQPQNNNRSIRIRLAQSDQSGVAASDLTNSYIYAALFVCFMLLLLLTVKILKNRQNASWLMGKNRIDNIQVIQQKAIDGKNKVVQISLRGVSYLLLIGPSSFFIDRIDDTSAEGDFNELLKANDAKLNEYLSQKNTKK
jgi:uncharacterized integral membrane protein